MKKTKERGITLIALVVTIIVLLILAGVTISLVLGQDGIFRKAEVAAQKTNEGQELDQVRLAVLEARTNNIVDKTDLKTELENSINKVYPGSTVEQIGAGEDITYMITLPNENTYAVDNNGNVSYKKLSDGTMTIDTVKIPRGFQHVTGNTREEGIVVADTSGNFEYVWIPVTKDEEGNPTQPYEETNGELNGKVIQLRGTGNSQYKEDTTENHDSKYYTNAIAEDIEAFKESVARNGGYFLGRYEAGIVGGTLAENPSKTAPDKNYTYWTEGTLVCKEGQQVWNWITQNKASELCRNIDAENNYTDVTSDLANSYTWDTTIVFIETCGTESNSSDYGNQRGYTEPYKVWETGEAILEYIGQVDKQCNIYDMATNCMEWSTATCTITTDTCVNRGGAYNSNRTTNYYSYTSTNRNAKDFSFRPILYWNV